MLAEWEEEEAYAIGKRDGYESAAQDLDLLTGGDDEYFASTLPGEGCPDAAAMKVRIADRFSTLRASLAEAENALKVVRQSLVDQSAARADPLMPRLTPAVLEHLRADAEAAYALAETPEERIVAHGLSLLCDWQTAGDPS